jgi:hypothetical protein
MARSSKPGGASHLRAYHQYLDKGHPKDYRSEEVEALTKAIQAKENRLVLALPGMGVSNLLRFLVTREDLFDREVTFAYVNCDGMDDCLNLDKLFEEIARQFYEQGLGNKLEEEVWGYERLKRLLTRVGGDPLDRVVVVVDQADRMLAVVDNVFYRKSKALTDLNKRVCYILAASPSTADRVDPDNLLFAGRRLVVGRLNEQDCTSAITEEARRLGVEFGAAAQERLARLTGGHPGLLRATSSTIVNEKLGWAISEKALVGCLLARDDVQYRCQKMWKELGPTQQAALCFLAKGQPNSVAADTLAWLRDFGLLDDHEGEYRLFSPIFQRFVAAQAASFEPITQETVLEPVRIDKPTSILRSGQEIIVAGKVFKGNQEVRVAPLELRLIACLKRERRIYTKDEIAAYVYYEDYEDQKRGVSDYRIENLVRQVRKRLGDHRYIETHWGQGYEFLG